MPPPEGSIIKLSDGSKWVVKGCVHPEDGYVAVPRLVGEKKLKTYGEAMRVIRRYYPHYLTRVPEIGRDVPVVPLEDIIEVLTPFDTFTPPETGLGRKACALVEALRERCGLKCGIAGSLLGGYSSPDSDIDVVCMDSENAYTCLRALRQEGVLTPLSMDEFEVESREVAEGVGPSTLTALASSRITQGTYKGAKYTLKILNCVRERPYLGPYLSIRYEEAVAILKGFDYRSPSIYPVELLRPATPYKEAVLLTHRVRFTELVEGALISGRALLHVRDGVIVVSFDVPGSEVRAYASHSLMNR
ncbi:MAG: hypothetical protein J7L55_00255 [Desulfurococcales archaeon]|nr:hypothetical protein [Desulfurococcales archaeon]